MENLKNNGEVKMQNSLSNLNVQGKNIHSINNSFEKSVVHAHTRKTKSGKLSNVKEYSDSRTKKQYIKESNIRESKGGLGFVAEGKVDVNGKELNYETFLDKDNYNRSFKIPESRREDLRSGNKQIVRLGGGKYLTFKTTFKMNGKEVDNEFLKTFLGDGYKEITTEINKDALVKWKEAKEQKEAKERKEKNDYWDNHELVKEFDQIKNDKHIKEFVKNGQLNVELNNKENFLERGIAPTILFKNNNGSILYQLKIEEHRTYSGKWDYRGTSKGMKYFVNGLKDNYRDTVYGERSKALRKIAQNFVGKLEAQEYKEKKLNAKEEELNRIRIALGAKVDVDLVKVPKYERVSKFNNKYIGDEELFKVHVTDENKHGWSYMITRTYGGDKELNDYTVKNVNVRMNKENMKEFLNKVLEKKEENSFSVNASLFSGSFTLQDLKELSNFINKNHVPTRLSY